MGRLKTEEALELAEKELGLAFKPKQKEQLELYTKLLLEWSGRVRLISRRDRDLIWEQHMLDCLALVSRLDNRSPVLDLGSGAGLPGVIVKIMRPDLSVYLLEPARMKSLFLREVIKHLGLGDAYQIRDRAERLAELPEWQNKFKQATARAVAPLPKLWGWIEPLLHVEGQFVAMKGPGAVSEFGEQVPEKLMVREEGLVLPVSKRERSFVAIERR